MSLIDYTYFQKGAIAIPNLKDENLANLNSYIDIYEDVYFNKMLGIELKNEFLTGLEAATPEQRWLDLRDGVEYVVDDKTYQWIGFINIAKLSPIANYVFCKLIQDEQTRNTGLGEVNPTTENGSVVFPYRRMGLVWSQMAEWNRSLFHFLNENEADYEAWVKDVYSSLLKDQNAIGF